MENLNALMINLTSENMKNKQEFVKTTIAYKYEYFQKNIKKK